MGYDVHCFAIVRVKITNVEGMDAPDAIDNATDKINWHDLFAGVTQSGLTRVLRELEKVDYVEWAEDFEYFLVDETGDEEFINSKYYASDGITPLRASNALDEAGRALWPVCKALNRLLTRASLDPSILQGTAAAKRLQDYLELIMEHTSSIEKENDGWV